MTENQILKDAETGRKVEELCRENEISTSVYLKGKPTFGAMEASDIRRLKELRPRTAVKSICTDLSLENEALKDLIAKML